ncbi:MAG: hypothetical protein D6723_02860 [Acidobacteria bacterium]|nr:MAG: hypothetical protein D6723_02860 [Acidobacteriota bacterium]
MKCTDPRLQRLMIRYELGALEPCEREQFAAHLLQCDECYSEVYTMEPFMAPIRERREAILRGEKRADPTILSAVINEGAQPPFWLRKSVLAAASLLIVIGAAVLYVSSIRWVPGPGETRPTGSMSPASETTDHLPTPWKELAIPKPDYVPSRVGTVFRDDRSTTAFERAMTAYQENRFAAAAEQLEVVSRLDPEHAEAHFYWGVSLLLAGHSREALSVLQQAVQLSAGTERERARYYLALAYLKTNHPESALAELEAVIKMNGSYRADAERLKQVIVEVLQ